MDIWTFSVYAGKWTQKKQTKAALQQTPGQNLQLRSAEAPSVGMSNGMLWYAESAYPLGVRVIGLMGTGGGC